MMATDDKRSECPSELANLSQIPLSDAPRPGDGLRPVNLFISYSHEDQRYMNQLTTHLIILRSQEVIADWNDQKLIPGDDWRQNIDDRIDAADCMLLLVSPDFLASEFCYSVEMKRALEKRRDGHALVIPVIVRPADWRHSPLAGLQALPKDAKPIKEWASRDRAWLDVANGLRRALAHWSSAHG
jgi:hypothetical protein